MELPLSQDIASNSGTPVRPRILFVAMQSSIHAARWIDCLADLGWDLHLFGVDDHPPNPNLRGVVLHVPISQPDAPGGGSRPALHKRALNLAGRLWRDPRTTLRTVTARVAQKVETRFPRWARFLKRHSRQSLGGSDARNGSVHIARFLPEQLDVGDRDIVPVGCTGQTAPARHGPAVLASVIQRVQPDLIHSMEFQHNAYRVLAARDLIGESDFPPWLATNWGSDIYLFGREEKHAAEIRRVLGAADLYSCECHRDLAIARDFGYCGPDLPVLPNSGGMDMAHIATLRGVAPPSRRKLIMVKGYDHFAGRAMVSLDVVERFRDALQDYTIVLYSVGAKPRERALALKASGTLDIKVIDWATHDEILRHFGRARMYMGISISDAISTSVLEAMAMGAFPIQTNTSCCEEWFQDGVGGFAIPPDDFELICKRFHQALNDDALVDRAAAINLQIIRTRLANEVIRPRVQDFYTRAFDYLNEIGRLRSDRIC